MKREESDVNAGRVRWLPLIDHRRERFWVGIAIQVLFFMATALPPFARQTIGVGPFAIAWWPSLCLLAIMTAAMVSDYFARPVILRVSLVFGGMLIYWMILTPLYWLIFRAVNPSDPRYWHPAAAALAAAPLIDLALRSSRWMLLPEGTRHALETKREHLDRKALEYVAARAKSLRMLTDWQIAKLPERANEDLSIEQRKCAATVWHQRRHDGSEWVVVQMWERGLINQTIASSGFELKSHARRTLSAPELRDGGFSGRPAR